MKRLPYAVIGGGAMGSAMLSALIGRKVFRAGSCVVAERSALRRAFLRRTFGVRVEASAARAVGKDTRVVVLAVKPQDAKPVMRELSAVLPRKAIVISIMAGISIKTLRRDLSHARIVRAMPNTPAQIGGGITVWTAAPAVAARDRKKVANMFAALGDELYVKDERLVDAATAVSGSGPAYVFAFAEAFLAGARRLGFSEADALRLVTQTLAGSAALLAKTRRNPGELRKQVTSKKGTTAAALRVLERAKLRRIFPVALLAAYRRAKAISRALD